MYRTLLTIALLSIVSVAFSQGHSGIIVHKDSRIETIPMPSSETPKKPEPVAAIVSQKGYRIVVLNTNDRQLAYKTKGELLKRYPQHAVYMSYQAPFFKLKIGNFIDRKEAIDLQKKLVSLVPKGVFIISETIVVKPSDK